MIATVRKTVSGTENWVELIVSLAETQSRVALQSFFQNFFDIRNAFWLCVIWRDDRAAFCLRLGKLEILSQ